MSDAAFDLFANQYDAWFADNQAILTSEARLIAHVWPGGDRVLSIGCGTGLFETVLKRDFDITITSGVEPSAEMAQIARSRGMSVQIATAEAADCGIEQFDTLMFNGSMSYVEDIDAALTKAFRALTPGGQVVLVDVPRESGYGLLYCLAKALDTWEDPVFAGVKPEAAYPLPFVKAAHWRTTEELIEALDRAGFELVRTGQTLTRHPVHANDGAEAPQDGHDRGDYVAVVARRGA